MFFGPTLTSLLMKNSDDRESVILYSLCLSTGNSEGLGHVRRNELSASLDVLGIPPSKAQVIDHPHLQDNITQLWDIDLISNVVNDFINQHDINIIITFDDKGISGHPNHIALPGGVLRLLNKNKNNHPPYRSLRLFTLITTPLLPKYTGALAHLSSKMQYFLLKFLPSSAAGSVSSNLFSLSLPVSNNEKTETQDPNSIIFVSGLSSYAMAFRAMLQHRSQLVWFRWLYVLFSRYMWVNALVEVPTAARAPIGPT
ncbi:hypothetical protein Clacol_004698 [Clathrus columnatus]|uniref:N-acetylglucosaminylphosphatidylinositol deacetylase n=1 Tax=Clathrus columnatus TaxID=1419009 RepID=A0AAV5A774_9AGAM|nr:hypothetical protein Clacol_004698 [Clathrus columnatus]